MNGFGFDEPRPLRETLSHATLRLSLGVVLVIEGGSKWLDLAPWRERLGGVGLQAPETAAMAWSGLECAIGLCLVLGLWTRLSSVLAALSIALGAVLTLELSTLPLPHWSGHQAVALSLLLSLFFILMGGGALSLDRALLQRARRRAIEQDEIWQRAPYVSAEDG